MYKYSVLMSVYFKDDADNLRLAIDSMLNQTVKPEQYVVVEDGKLTSELNTVIDEYENQYPELFTIVKIAQNKGLANALNEGIKVCRNELVARMDADDISLPERCEKELECFELYPDLDICGCQIDEFYDDVRNIRTARVVPTNFNDIKKIMRKRQPFNHPTVIYKKEKVIEYGGYSLLKRKEDFDLFSKMITNNCRAINLEEHLYLYRANDSNYKRRKNFENYKSALNVYVRHIKRGGCTIIDFIIICIAETIFFIMPLSFMRKISDKFLREKVKK